MIMRQFDLHEFLGYIAPGMLLLVGIRYVLPETEAILPMSGITFGEFGIGIVLAYVVGQLLQTIGNGLEMLWWWLWGGMPTDWLRTGKHEIIAPVQVANVEARVRKLLGDRSFKLAEINRKQWYAIIREVCAAISGMGRNVRIDVFNGYYGLCRGIAASMIVLLACGVMTNISAWGVHLALVVLIALAIYRMHRFAVHYGREVFVQFLQVPEKPDNQRKE